MGATDLTKQLNVPVDLMLSTRFSYVRGSASLLAPPCPVIQKKINLRSVSPPIRKNVLIEPTFIDNLKPNVFIFLIIFWNSIQMAFMYIE